MKEIGGYFELENFISNEYYENLIALNTCRNALIYILKVKKIKKLYIPSYLCDSISNILKRENIEFDFFNIDEIFLPIFDKNLENDEYILIVNYYGQLNDIALKNLSKRYKNIIVDNTQAFFQRPLKGIDTIYSCRKFFGVPDGAYVSTNVKLKENIIIDNSKDRFKHLLGRYEGAASEYYKDFKINDTLFITEPIKYMSKLTSNILGAVDYKKTSEIRNRNFKYLHNFLKKYNKLKLEIPEGAFSYPLYLENADEIRKELLKYKIYIPTLWSNVLNENMEDSIEYKYAKNILPIPCDQRYDIEDMEFIIECINVGGQI